MNRRNLLLLTVALGLMGGTASLLAKLRNHQKLGLPGVKTHELAGSIRLQADLPERVLDYESEWLEIDNATLGTLPKDTSFGQRRYKAPDGYWLDLRVVLMGIDRTSLHKPQFCLTGQGFQIDEAASAETSIHVERPIDYELPVVELVSDKEATIGGQSQKVRGIYVYWYVADDALSASTSGFQRMWLMASRLLRTGVLQRWAYVSCFTACSPGQETAAYERMKRFIAAAVPEFQLHPGPRTVGVVARE